ncbi:molybdopterin-dependent oxidoreductase [Arthrobacter sp. 35W]|uniref:molybdopterin-dependent oxidoreductase n=1 Tax=Arthrobacter sp. 35W TaxID=1132441 RepID=UPI000404137E|nr:molybdopterin-dependent oxidoreductase [Arthrobacter sp. 35W]
MGTTGKTSIGRPGRLAALAPGAVAGVVAAAILFGVAELLAAFIGPRSSPLVAVGSTFIDFTPPWLKDFAVATFGTADKLVLFISMAVVATVGAALAGVLAVRRFNLGATLVLALAVLMAVCVATRAGAAATDILPTLLGTAAGLAALRNLVSKAPKPNALGLPSPIPAPVPEFADSANRRPAAPPVASTTAPGRRAFFATAAVLAATAVVLGVGGKALSGIRGAAEKVREALKLPAAAKPAPPLPAGVQAPVDGVGPFVTPNADFYRIDTALIVPDVDPSQWKLHVHGMVEKEFYLSFQDLLDSQLIETHVTLTCVSNVVGGNLAGNAKWLGYPLREVLARAKPLPGADMVLSTSIDGFSASTPLPILQDGRDAILAVGMNGEPLPLEHGFPVRMVVPGLYGYVSATKWVVDLEVTTFAQKEGYWTSRGWSSHGPIKTASRVEVPRALARVPAGTVAVGGTAWAQTVGISAVQVQLDGGPWQEATLAAEATVDTWRQWSHSFDSVAAGSHNVRVRAVDAKGQLQIEQQAPPQPDGSTGWHNITFTTT